MNITLRELFMITLTLGLCGVAVIIASSYDRNVSAQETIPASQQLLPPKCRPNTPTTPSPSPTLNKCLDCTLV